MANDTTTDVLTPTQWKAISALLSEPSIRQAAIVSGVKERTLYHWVKQPAFAEEYRTARREAVQQAVTRLQQYSGHAAATLVALTASNHPAIVRLNAAKAILEFAIHAVEFEDLAARMDAMEAHYAKPKNL